MNTGLIAVLIVGVATGIISSVIYEGHKETLNTSYTSFVDRFMNFKNDGVKNA